MWMDVVEGEWEEMWFRGHVAPRGRRQRDLHKRGSALRRRRENLLVQVIIRG